MAPPGRERFGWSVLLVALLLVTPCHLPALRGLPSGSSGDSTSSSSPALLGIVAVGANAGGQVVVELLDLYEVQWGNEDGKFAGYTGLGLNNKECDDLYESDNPIYSSETEADSVLTNTYQGIIASNTHKSDANVRDGLDKFSKAWGYTNNALIAVYWITDKAAQRICGYTEVDNEDAPSPPADPPTKDGVFYDMWRMSRRLYDSSQKNEASKYMVNILRHLVAEFITPLKQAGTIVQFVGKAVGQPSPEKAGKFVAELMDEPEEKLKRVVNTTKKGCNSTSTFLSYYAKALDVLEIVDTVWGITENYVILPWTYITCSRQQQYVRMAISQVRSGTAQTPTGRKLLAVSGGGVQDLALLRDKSEQVLQASQEFRDKIDAIATKMNNTITPPLTAAYDTWDTLSNVAEEILGALSEALDFFDFMPDWLSAAIFGFADKLSFITECPDWACGIFSFVGDITDWVTQELIKKMNIPGVSTLEELFKKALREAGAPIPDWWSNGFTVNLPFDDVTGLFDLKEKIQDAIDDLTAELEQAIKDLLDKVLNIPSVDDGTNTMEVSSDSDSDIRRRISTSSGTTIDIRCPPDTVGVYMDSFTVWALPDCNADYTAWLRFPCAGNSTSCTVDWTIYDWKCYKYQNKAVPGVAGISIPQRYVTAVYDCVTQAGLAKFNLLPELLSVSKDGNTTLANVAYASTANLPSMNHIKAFAEGIGQQGTNDIKNLLTTPQPGIKSNAPSNVATATAPFDQYSQGSLSYPLVNPWFDRTVAEGYKPLDVTCSGAAVFGLPSLLIEGTDVDACYDTAYWESFLARYPQSRELDTTYDVRFYRYLIQRQVEALRSDMCGWRMVSKRGYIGALKGVTNTTLQSMVPPMLLPWAGPPTEQQFRDFWGPRGACEHFSDGGDGRSHLSYSNWKVTRPSTAAECEQKVLAPICYPGGFPESPTSEDSTWSSVVVCNTSSMSAQWPLVSPTEDPVLKTAVVPTTVCGTNVPTMQLATACSDPYPKWCGPRQSALDGTGPGATTPDLNPTLDNMKYFSQMTYYFADLSNTTVAAAQRDANLATAAQQWAAECALDYIRGQEFAARKALLDAYAAQQITTLDPACAAKLAACQLTKGSCPISEIFRCSKLLGVVQYACTPDPASFSSSTLTLVFKVSLVSGAKQIGCGANQELQIASAEVGAGRDIKDVMKVVVKNMCNSNGTSCNLDINHPALNTTGDNDVLKVLWKCECLPGYEGGANGTCTACAAGSYRSNNASACTKTPPGSYTNETASTAPTSCPAGTFAANYGQAQCTLCPTLTYSAAIGATNASTCIPCVGTNAYSAPGAAQCTTCPLGTVLSVSTTNTENGTAVVTTCATCPPGTYRTAAEEQCTACNPGTYASYGGTNTSCTAAPAGHYAALPGTIAPTACEPGSYQPNPGSTACLKCSNGGTTNTSGSTDAAACIPVATVPASELPRLEALANTPAGSSSRRALRAVTDLTGPCGQLASALAGLGLTPNASTFLNEVGNSFCSASPWLNSPACNYDGGDCCPSTCQPLCTQVPTSSNDTSETVQTYISLSWSCAKFQCRDPAAVGNNTAIPHNCTGIAVNKPNSMLQRLLLPVIKSDVVDVEQALQSIAPAKEGSTAGTPGVCDPHLNTEGNEWDGGDCCEGSCKPNPTVPGSCTSIPAAACLNPKYSSSNTQPPPDVIPPVVTAPPDYTTTCGAIMVGTAGLTAYDKTDGIIPLSNPAISSSNALLSINLTQPLPCPATPSMYTVSLTWTAADKAGNTANATQNVYVMPASAPANCSGNPSAPPNASNFSCTATAQGSNCSTVCESGYNLTNGSLLAVCSSGVAPTWSNVTGVCSPATIIRSAELYVTAVSSRRTNFSLPSSAGPILSFSRRSAQGRAEAVKASDGSDLIMYLSKFGFVGNETFTVRSAQGRTNVTVQVTPGSCENNMCGLLRQSGLCDQGRCLCPAGSQLNSTFIRNPDTSARAVTPLVPACRYTYFTPTRDFSLTGMRTKPGETLRVSFTLAQPGSESQCAGPDAALLPKVVLHRTNVTCGGTRRAARRTAVQAAPARASIQEISTMTAGCQGGEYTANVTVPARFLEACIAVSVKLADNTTRRSTMQVA